MTLSFLQYFLGVISGGIVGFSLGMFGGGGSILAVPLMVYVVGVPNAHMAIGTSAFAVAANAFTNMISHWRLGNVKWRCAGVYSAAGIVGAYGGAVYLSTILGAWIADRILGAERVLFLSAIVIMAGHIALALLPGFVGVGVGLVLVAIGSGGLKATATSVVGTLYGPDDTRRDGGFSLFYLGINLGAFAGPLLTGLLQSSLGFHWGFGLAAVGMALLAAPAAWYASPVDQAEIAGSEQAGLMVTGNADSDQMSAGDVTQITLVPMVDAKPIETVEAEPVQPDSAVQAVEHVTAEAPTAETVEPVTDAPPERTPTETAQPEQPPTETPAPEILTARADPADTGDAVVQPSPRAEPVEPVEETQQAQPQPAETVEPDAVATPQVVAVLPEPRPSLQKSPEKKAEPARQPKDTAKPPEKNQEKPRKKKANAGAGGANQADSKRGVANGSAEGKAAIASSGGSLPGVGNAAVSNYPGKVAAKLRRVSRTISRAAQASARSNAQVSFVVGAGGDVRSVRLVKSSGSPGLDDEALSIIRRAAPFPPIPAGAGRSNWAFTLPIGPY